MRLLTASSWFLSALRSSEVLRLNSFMAHTSARSRLALRDFSRKGA